MKKVFFAVAAIATISFAFTTFSEVLPIGASIPKADLKLKDISGKEVSLKDAKKKNGAGIYEFPLLMNGWSMAVNEGNGKKK